MKAHVVIGAGLGDEGKGRTVDWFASRTINAVVVRCNGGAQAAHTVQLEGKRTVFHHVGSGHLAGADTYLGKEFIVNPILFNQEIQALPKLGKIVCHPECRVTTPYDMMYNQALEISRGDKKHGSCGLGINATVDRHEEIPFYVSDLDNTSTILSVLNYTRTRLLTLVHKQGLSLDTWLDNTRGLEDAYVKDCLLFMHNVQTSDEKFLIGREVVFEMAQGLLLDEHHEWFPYVTRSRTGLDNVIAMLPKIPSITELEIVYVTRGYMTRHGEGPLPNECDWKNTWQDETNLYNKWQGFLRFAELDLDLLFTTIQKDVSKAEHILPVSKTLCITCMDQLSESGVVFRQNGVGWQAKAIGFLSHVKEHWDGRLMYSTGAERWAMTTWQDARKRHTKHRINV